MIEEIFAAIGIGILTASLYSLISMGLTLLWGVARVINAAHGELYLIGGYITVVVATSLSSNPFVTLLISMIGLFLMGIIVEKALVKPLRVRTGMTQNVLVITFGLGITIQNLLVLLFGFNYTRAPSFIGMVEIFGVTIWGQRLLVVAVTLTFLLALYVFLSKTKMGMAIRATSQDTIAARAVGIDINRIYAVTFAISAALSGAAGSLLSPILWFTPEGGFPYMIKGFVIVVLGGFGSMKGALIGSYILGISETLCVFFFIPELREIIGLWIMLGTLMLRPTGLFGKRVLLE